VPFHPDLVASLRCHHGVEPDDATAQLTSSQLSSCQLSSYGPLCGVADIVRNTTFLRSLGVGETGLPVTLGIGRRPSDGLFIACRPGPRYGQVGRRFDEDTPSFARRPSLRHVLADFADALEGGLMFLDRVPLAVAGKLRCWWDLDEVLPGRVQPLDACLARLTLPIPPPPVTLLAPVPKNR
jgi:hypothetical protein